MNSPMLTGNAPGLRRFGGLKRQRIMLAALATVALMLTAAAAVIPQLADDTDAAVGDTFTVSVPNANDGKAVDMTFKILTESGTTGKVQLGNGSQCAIGANTAGTLTVPASVTYNSVSYSVVSIAAWAFYNCNNLTTVTLPDSITLIANSAFESCSLSAINIPDGVTAIQADAFHNCKNLTAIALPAHLTTISDQTFWQCDNLKTVTIPNTVTEIGSSSFKQCPHLSGVIIPASVTKIDASAFELCTSLTAIAIPDSVTTIGYFAFSSCTGLTSITFGSGLQTVDTSAFNSLHFYDTDGSTPLTVTVQDLAGATFSGTAAKLVKQIPAVPAHSVATYQITAAADSGARLTPSDGWTVTAGGDCTFSIALQPGYALTSVQAVNATVYSDGSAYHVTNARGPVALTVATVYVADQADSGSAGGDSGTDEITTAVAIAAGAAVICAIIGLAFWRKL